MFHDSVDNALALRGEYSGDQSPQNLISRCPVLQELCLETQWIGDDFNSIPLDKIKISSPCLKTLRIQHCSFEGEVLIDAPKLEYLYIEDDEIRTKYSLTNPWSLVEVHINKFCDTVVELLTCVSVAKRLMLASQSLWAIRHFHHDNVPTMFPNLVKLDVDIHWSWESWSVLFNVLHKMPLLEQFTISYLHLPGDIDHTSGILPLETPNCLRFKMKEITILNEGVVTRRQVILIGYLLRHSTVLERVTLNANNIEPELRKELLNFQCGSHMCRIELL
uniref:FBD-associated F-box protein At5g18780-like n=1 Tax=Erigeron canadensis TaxID=72917 RepID=UPI001CB937D0|nr:FBD-associated F-box protein At5g18780-like [Erigeron canadensis]